MKVTARFRRKRRILVLQGHPDASGTRFCHALGSQYAHCAAEAGHEVRTLEVARIVFPLLKCAADWEEGEPCEAIREAQASITWAEHLVIVFPLWLGDMPAVLKGFFEQVLRPGFAIGGARSGGQARKLLTGKSARIIVTMGMPAFYYSLYYRAHSVKSLKRNILAFCGIAPVSTSIIGTVGTEKAEHREQWLEKVAMAGFRGS